MLIIIWLFGNEEKNVPAYEIVSSVNRELTALKPMIEETLSTLKRKDVILPQLFEKLFGVERRESENPFICEVLSVMDQKVNILELNIRLAASRALGFMVEGDDKKSSNEIREFVKKEVEKMNTFLKERVVAALPNYSAIRYGVISASEELKTIS